MIDLLYVYIYVCVCVYECRFLCMRVRIYNRCGLKRGRGIIMESDCLLCGQGTRQKVRTCLRLAYTLCMCACACLRQKCRHGNVISVFRISCRAISTSTRKSSRHAAIISPVTPQPAWTRFPDGPARLIPPGSTCTRIMPPCLRYGMRREGCECPE